MLIFTETFHPARNWRGIIKNMQYRQLGSTGIAVSEIGFGAWGIGGSAGGSIAYGSTDDQESRLALQLAYDLGVTFYDTSDFYGYGHSESLIGDALKEVRQKIVIATKVGLLDAKGAQDFSVRHIRTSIEKSLKRLKTDAIDLYQLHSPPVALLKEDEKVVQTMHALVQEGKVRSIGISARSPEEGLYAVKEFGFQVVQVNFNLLDQRPLENGLFDFCKQQGIGIIGRTPLCFGFLSGRYSTGTSFNSDDHRSRWPAEQIKRWNEGHRLFLKAFENRNGQSDAQLALRFCLSHEAVSTVIPGILNRKEAGENTKASPLGRLSKRELKKIEEIYKTNQFFVKKEDREQTDG